MGRIGFPQIGITQDRTIPRHQWRGRRTRQRIQNVGMRRISGNGLRQIDKRAEIAAVAGCPALRLRYRRACGAK